MPLSDRENQILQDIERQLSEQDPRFAHEVGGASLRSGSVRNVRVGAGLFALGFVLLLVDFVFFRVQLFMGVAAFLVMVAGATLAFQNLRRLAAGRDEEDDQESLLGRVESRIRDIRRRDGSK